MMSDRRPRQFAPGVYQLLVGDGLLRANVYFIRSGLVSSESSPGHLESDWVLMDTGVSGCDIEIREAAAGLFGPAAAPSGIVVSHAHPDHVGSAAALARHWQCPVYMHGDEIRMITGDLTHFEQHSFTIDRWLILPILKLTARRHLRNIVSRGGLREFAHPLGVRGALTSERALPVPGLPDWVAIPTPGHTPGHVALFRERDRLLLSGDSVVTTASPLARMTGENAFLSRSPWYFTWDIQRTRDSLLTLAELKPSIIGSGHGLPREGTDLATHLRSLAAGR